MAIVSDPHRGVELAELLGQLLHVVFDLLVRDAGVDLRRADVRMA